MAREKELFRDNLELLKGRFNSEVIPLKDVAEYIGADERTLKTDKFFPVKKIGNRYYVPVVALASWLS